MLNERTSEPRHQTPTEPTAPSRIGELLSELRRQLEATGQLGTSWRPSLVTNRDRGNAAAEFARKVGERHAGCCFDNYAVTEKHADNRPSQQEAVEQLRNFATEFPNWMRRGGGLVLFGRPGTGKDHLAIAAGFEVVLRHGFTVDWINGLELFANIRRLIGRDGDEQEYLRRFERPAVLIVSDPLPPKSDASAYNADVLFRILDRRYRAMKSTWLTMNVADGEEAERRLASAIVDRVRDGSLCLECNWPSHRRPVDLCRNSFDDS